MNISKRDKNLLLVFAMVCILFVYFYFIFTSQRDEVSEKRTQKDMLQTEYNTAEYEIRSLDDRKSQVKELTTKEIDKASTFYPEILQYKIISEIDKLLLDSKVDGSIQFSELSVKGIEDLTSNAAPLPDTTFKSYVDVIRQSEEKFKNAESNSATAIQQAPASGSTATAQTVEMLTFTLSFTGTDEAFNKFMESLENYDRQVVISAFNARPKNDTEIAGTMTLEVYGIPKATDIDDNYANWVYEKVTGKTSLFTTGSATGGVTKKSTEGENDLVASIKSADSDASSFKMGLANDASKTSYIYVDENEEIDVEVVFTEVNGTYFYKYKADNSNMPGNGNANGITFNPKSEDILFEIFSEARKGNDDKSQIALNITNNTKKPVTIKVTGDDATNPRVKVKSEGTGVVNVK